MGPGGGRGQSGPCKLRREGCRWGGHPQRGPSLPWDGQLSSRVMGTEVWLWRAAWEPRRPQGDTQGERVASPHNQLPFVRLKTCFQPRFKCRRLTFCHRRRSRFRAALDDSPFSVWSAWRGEAWGGQGEDRGLPSPAVSAGVALGNWGLGLLGPTGAPAHGGALRAVSVAGLGRGSCVRLGVKPCGAPGRGAVREVGGRHVQGLSADPLPAPCSGAWAPGGLEAPCCAGWWWEGWPRAKPCLCSPSSRPLAVASQDRVASRPAVHSGRPLLAPSPKNEITEAT